MLLTANQQRVKMEKILLWLFCGNYSFSHLVKEASVNVYSVKEAKIKPFKTIFLDTCAMQSLENGEVTYNREQVLNLNGRYPIGTVAMYTCKSGYSLSGLDSNTCQNSGNWQKAPPTCNEEGNKKT